ncbi:hypothetical protein Avbf_00818 [Armadillidium vulgare]|nr:hypothetical protein Avbf_00818 [Armadillidium vulgare]
MDWIWLTNCFSSLSKSDDNSNILFFSSLVVTKDWNLLVSIIWWTENIGNAFLYMREMGRLEVWIN